MNRSTFEPDYLAGPPLFWRLLTANLIVVFGGAVIGTALTRQFVLEGAFTPLTHMAMVLSAIGLSALLTSLILRLAFRPLRALREAIEQTEMDGRPMPALKSRPERFGDPDVLAVAAAVHRLWNRLEQHVRLLEDTNRRLEAQRQELAEKTVQLEYLAAQVVEAHEEERRRIARELHDDTMQSMAALIMGLERGMEAMPAEVPHLSASHRTVAHLRDLANRMLDDLRHLALDLRPSVLDDYGLVAALQWLVQTQQERHGLPVAFEVAPDTLLTAPDAERLPPAVETALFRIAQEALSNVARHARAQRATVRLRCAPSRVSVEVEDDGVGMPRGHQAPPGHMGLFNMRERAALLGGRCEFVPGTQGRGTLVRAVLPLTVTPAPVTSDVVAATPVRTDDPARPVGAVGTIVVTPASQEILVP